jgi:hypothetical protein
MSVAQQNKRRRKELRQDKKSVRMWATRGITRAPGPLKSVKSAKGKK